MIEINNKERCSGCGACLMSCPKHCIKMHEDNEGFLYPKADIETCTDCHMCENVCPIMNTAVRECNTPNTYYAVNRDGTVRLNSSSGGVFSALGEYILSQNGAVFGAVFQDDFNGVHHVCADNISELRKMCGSKYVQSATEKTYCETKVLLEAGKTVMFTGTPCQIAGLKAYLGKEYINLITQDFICHGVPSPKAWRLYADFQRKKTHSRISEVSFRDKVTGWKKYSLSIKFDNKNVYSSNLHKDLFMRGFLSDIYLRPSCYNCAFRGKERVSDISLADFWGLSSVLPGFDDDKGASLIVVNSRKGEEMIKAVSDKLIIKKVDSDAALIHNSAYSINPKLSENRKQFMDNMDKKSFKRLILKNTPLPIWKQVKPKLKRKLYIAARVTGMLNIYQKLRGEKR